MAEELARRTPVTRVAISVEGRTEEEFVKNVLADHLRRNGVEMTPILLGRARGRSGGGSVSVKLLVSEMVCLIRSYDAVTSLVDFYGFRSKGDKTVGELEEQVLQQIRERLGGGWYPKKVLRMSNNMSSRVCCFRMWTPSQAQLTWRKSLLKNCGGFAQIS